MIPRVDVKYFKKVVTNLGKETDVDISARCPVCGDSKKNQNSKRLHLYKKGDYVLCNCFNGDCKVKNRTMYTFLRDFFPEHVSAYKQENFRENIKNLKSGDVFAEFRKASEKSLEFSEKASDNENPVKAFIDLKEVFIPLENSLEALQYVENRRFDYLGSRFLGKWFFSKNDIEIDGKLYRTRNSVIIPLYSGERTYGFYSRNISSKDFCTYMHEANTGYKIWNFFDVDKTKDVYVFEGIFDALSSGLENVVALLGASLPDERLSEITPIFVLDNDRTGLVNSLRYSSKYRVYVQPREFPQKDMNELKKENPDLCIPDLINKNLFTSIAAKVKISSIL